MDDARALGVLQSAEACVRSYGNWELADKIGELRDRLADPASHDAERVGVDDVALEAAIEEADGAWHEDEFRIEAGPLMDLLRSVAALSAQQQATPKGEGATTTCFHCGAPCREEVLMRGGDHGWGDDKSRTVRRYVAPVAAQGGGGDAVAWQYRYRSEGPGAFVYNTFRHPVDEMNHGDEIEWWVFGVKPAALAQQGPVVDEAMVERALEAFENATGRLYTDWRYPKMRAALTAALHHRGN